MIPPVRFFPVRMMTASLMTAALCGTALSQVADGPDASIAGIPVNYTEAKAGTFTLPELLKLSDGTAVADAKTWTDRRRPELLKLYASEIYGKIPSTAPAVTWEVVSTDRTALGGTAVMKLLAGHMGSPTGPAISATMYTPANATKPVPVLVNITFNFGGGRGGRGRGPTTAATATAPATAVAPATATRGAARGPAATPPRGSPAELIAHGFGLVTVTYNTIETDTDGQPNVNLARKLALPPGQTAPAADEWGTIAAWAWGLSRVVDYLETDPTVDAKRVGITGVSRLGKTVLWAGANDPRIALVIASCSGEGGAALARRNYGETVAHLVAPTRYPYQFAGNYAKYAKDTGTLPVDSHMLVALMAPRPLLLQTGNTDAWSDPKGEFLAAVSAGPVYSLFSKQPLTTEEMPAAGQLLGQDLAYYMHAGGHGTVPGDWDTFLKFLELHLKPGQ